MGADMSGFLAGAKEAIGGMEGIKDAVESLNESFLALAGIDLSIRSIREFVAEGVKIYASMQRAGVAATKRAQNARLVSAGFQPA